MPDWSTRIAERLAGLRLDPATEADTIEELLQHLEDRYNDLVARGMTAVDADAQAWRELEGDGRLVREIARARTSWPMAPAQDTSHGGMQGVVDDLRFAWRQMWHAPWFTLAALLTVTLTVGVNTAMLSVADAVLFRPLPYADPDGVAIIQMQDRQSGRRYTMTPYAVIEAIADCCRGVSDLALIDGRGTAPAVWIDTPDGVDAVPTVAVTANYFTLLGVLPARGRVFTGHDAGREGRAALLSHAGWLRLFGGDESVIGQPVTLGTSTFEILGVLPPGYVFPSLFAGRPSLVVLREPLRPGATGGTFHAIARLAPGVSRAHAQAEIDVATSAMAASPGGTDSGPVLDDVRSVLYPIGRPVMRYLLLAAGLLLLLGCANLSNMLLVRARHRLHDTAVRLALGATRMRLVRPMVCEALMIGAAGALLAVGVTSVGFEALLRQVPPAVHGAAPVGVDSRVVMLSLLMGLGSAMVFGIVPAWRAAGIDVRALMQRRGGRAGRAGLGRPMVTAQVAIALAVVFGAAAAGRAFVSLIQTPLVFSADRVLRIRMAPPPDVKDRQQFYAHIIRVLAALPDVETAGGAGILPFGNHAPDDGGYVPGSPQLVTGIVHALPGYVETASIPILRGRSLAWDDVKGDPNVAVVSESAARVLFPGKEPLGGVFENRRGGQFVVIGVAADVRDLSSRSPVPLSYVIPASDTRLLEVLARTRVRSEAIRDAIRAALAPLGRGRRPTVEWWADSISAMHVYRDPRFQTLVLGTLAALALGLTSLGIFSVVAYLVAARTHEMGVRLAIGASPASLVRLVMGQALLPVSAGVCAGMVLVMLMRGLAEAQLASVDTRDPVMLAAAILTVVAAASGAAYLPARRATRVNPTEVLRAE